MLRSAVTMVFIALTAAEACPSVCYLTYAPICATDGVNERIFSSSCMMNLYNCEHPQSSKLSALSQISHQFPYTF